MTYQITTPLIEEKANATYVSVTITIDGYKAPIHVFVRYNGQEVDVVNVMLNNASQRAYGSMGKEFGTIEEASTKYSGKRGQAITAALAAIEEAYNVEEEEVQIASVEVTAAEGKDGEIVGTYETVEAFEAAVKASFLWINYSGGKIWITVHFTNEDSHGLRYDVSNYNDEEGRGLSGNGIVDLRARLITWADYVGSDRWLQFQNGFNTSTEARNADIQRAKDLKIWVANTPVQEAIEATVSEDQPQTSYSYQITTEAADSVEEAPVSTTIAATMYTLWNTSTTYSA